MPTFREDNWTGYEDKILANTILDYIRNGKTQSQAFEDAGEVLDRSSGACGYRWNAILRKDYKEAIRLARRAWRHQKLDMVRLEIPKEPSVKKKEKNTPKTSKEASELIYALNDVYEHTSNAQVKYIVGQAIAFIKKSENANEA